MGVRKHGKDSASAKACKRYKETGRRLTNKASKTERVAKAVEEGKNFKNTKRTMKPSVIGEWNYRMAQFQKTIDSIAIEKPSYSERLGKIIWGWRNDRNKN